MSIDPHQEETRVSRSVPGFWCVVMILEDILGLSRVVEEHSPLAHSRDWLNTLWYWRLPSLSPLFTFLLLPQSN